MKQIMKFIFIKFLLASLCFSSSSSLANDVVDTDISGIINSFNGIGYLFPKTEVELESFYPLRLFTPKKGIIRKKIGTGFFISPNVFVTALHVVEESIRKKKLSKSYLGKHLGHKQLKIKKVLALSVEADLALLETEESVLHYLPVREQALDDSSESLFALGYRMSGEKSETVKNIGQINNLYDRWLYFNVNLTFLHGMSGGPVIDSQGQVVAVSSMALYNTIFTVQLRDFLHKIDKFSCEDKTNKECLNDDIDLIHQKAENGDMSAQYTIGFLYYIGTHGFKKRQKKAKEWLSLAAEQGHPIAQYLFGKLLAKKKKHREEAIHWLQEAGDMGFTPAKYDLGLIMKKMDRIEEATSLFKEAGEAGMSSAIYELGLIMKEMDRIDKAMALFTIAGEMDLILATYELKKLELKERFFGSETHIQ